MRTLAARAPARIDFGGGWTDVPPYSNEAGGAVCNIAIGRYATVTLAAQDGSVVASSTDRVSRDAGDAALVRAAVARSGAANVRAILANDFPVGAGLGGSSAAGVAMIGALSAWLGTSMSGEELAEASRRLETDDLHVAGGWQDHYAAALGGALGLRFESGKTHVKRIVLAPSTVAELEQRLLIVYTGQSRISGDTITAVVDAYRAGEPRVLNALASMKSIAIQQIDALTAGDVDSLGALVGEHWHHQRSLHPAIPTPRIDAIIEAAATAGASGSKALGASGGGCVLVIAPAHGRQKILDAIAPLGDILDFEIASQGFTVVEDGEVSSE